MRDGTQYLVAQQVAVRVVDRLEVVDIGEQQGAPGRYPADFRDRALQPAPVVQPRQRIQERLGLGLLQALRQGLHFLSTALELLGQLGSDHAHVLRIREQLGDHVADHLQSDRLVPQPCRVALECLVEVGRVRAGALRNVRRLLEEKAQALADPFERVSVSREDVLRVHSPYIGVR